MLIYRRGTDESRDQEISKVYFQELMNGCERLDVVSKVRTQKYENLLGE